MKNKVLIIFKYPREHWNQPVINKFSNFYDTEYLYISDYKNKNFTEIVNEINSLIKLKNIILSSKKGKIKVQIKKDQKLVS